MGLRPAGLCLDEEPVHLAGRDAAVASLGDDDAGDLTVVTPPLDRRLGQLGLEPKLPWRQEGRAIVRERSQDLWVGRIRFGVHTTIVRGETDSD